MTEPENHMVIDWPWESVFSPTEEKLKGPGYTECGTGTFVAEEGAYEYALDRMDHNEALRELFVEWFYDEGWERED